jgi:glycine/D-amino acid oxidase-like deaminating enzyme
MSAFDPKLKNGICIVGAGVVGLSCALKLKTACPEIAVTIIASEFYNETTAFGSAGLWEPYQIVGTPDDLINSWGEHAFLHFRDLYFSADAGATGVQQFNVFQLFTAGEDATPPSWKDIVYNYTQLPEAELRKMGFPARFVAGSSFGTYVVEQK